MKRILFAALSLGLSVAPAFAQSLEDLNVQVHGYAAQGFLYTTKNNIFYADSSDGSPAWTEAVVNVSAVPMPKLRVAVQARYQLLGTSGDKIVLDWAAADYQVNDRFGVRFGKVKTPWGLFNETQDLDSSFMWALLPQSVYDITTRTADLAHFGGVAYGRLGAGSQFGKLEYRLWGGEQVTPTDDGSFADVNDAGNPPQHPMTNVTCGGALHWLTPVRGLMIGASDARMNSAHVDLQNGSESFDPWNNLSYFAKFEKDKVMLAGEWNRQASTGSLLVPAQAVESLDSDVRGWFIMGSYKLSSKLTAGAYYSRFVDEQQPAGPDQYSNDWTVSARYDVNQFVYLKAEQHFIDGTALSFANANNPVLQPNSRLTALRVGLSF